MKGIHQYQHFSFNSNEPGIVSAQKTSGGILEKIVILKEQELSLLIKLEDQLFSPRVDFWRLDCDTYIPM